MGKVISLELWRRGLRSKEQELYQQLVEFPKAPVRFVGKVKEFRAVLSMFNTEPKEVA